MAKPAVKKPKPSQSKTVTETIFQYRYYIILFAVPFLLYSKTIGFDYSYHDDDVIILDGALSLEQFGIADFFGTDAWLKKAEIELYRPWQSITYAFDYAVAKTNPYIYHLHNVIIFSFAIVLLFVFLQQFHFTAQAAFILSLFYSVHYLMSHAVCWIPARGDLYLVFFGLTCILLFIKWAKENKPYILFISAFFFFMSLISKESAITILPLLAMIYYFNFEQKISLKKLWWTIPYLMVAGIYFMLRKPAVIKTPFLGIDAFIYNLPTLPEEIFKFFIPLDYSVMPGFNHAITIAGLVLIFVLSGIIYWQRKNIDLKIILTGVCFFIFPLLPSLFYKPVFVGSSYDYLDHRMFFCGIGLLIITGILLKKYIESDSKIFKATGYAVVVISAVISFAYSETYKNYNNFYRNAISKNEKSGLALTNYSNLLFNKEGKYEEAMQLIEKAIALNPDSMYYTFKKCGYAYMQKDIPVTKNCSEKLITKWPNKYDSNFIRSGYFLLTKDYEESIRYSTKTIEINPNKADGYFNRGLAYKETGNFDAAINDFTTCTRLSPQFANAYFHRGNIYGNTGNFSAALIDFDKYVKLSPDEAMGYFYRGQAYCFSGNAADGCRDLKKAQKMGLPDNIDNLLQKFCQ